jgi:hypothetical protein
MCQWSTHSLYWLSYWLLNDRVLLLLPLFNDTVFNGWLLLQYLYHNIGILSIRKRMKIPFHWCANGQHIQWFGRDITCSMAVCCYCCFVVFCVKILLSGRRKYFPGLNFWCFSAHQKNSKTQSLTTKTTKTDALSYTTKSCHLGQHLPFFTI